MRAFSRTFAASLMIIFVGSLPSRADDAYQKIIYVRVGDTAPAFQCKDDRDKLWRSKDHVGKKVVVVVFYMGDFFSDCTQRLSNFRDYKQHLAALGAEVVGVSGDQIETHVPFKTANRLNFPLLADFDGRVGEVFGVYPSSGGPTRVKDSKGKEIQRYQRGVTEQNWTFVIGLDGKVIYKDTNTNAKEDGRRVYEALYRIVAEQRR